MSESVSVVCITHGRPDFVVKCLQSCVDQNYSDKEVVVVFNPADDQTEREIRSRFRDSKILRTHKNLGFFPALNLAIANCTGDYVMIVDDDAWFLSLSTPPLVIAAIESTSRIAGTDSSNPFI